ncbi:hypothetical protein BV22DRAFT_1135251 [Leucogyrophana mollusca]|uniref:Uncharacterized protein n=1 Tax=Leucogyrophana mollusca TaxID=85980 RepID=A0ACB8AVS2_9AGAM|nr:hypothetical protein BV22DRAFT_1135251 [Leucogyrophana mollusca]
MSAIIPLHADKSNFVRAYRYKDDPKSPWVTATMSRPLPIKFGDHLIVKAILSDTRSWFFGTVTGVARLEKHWVILELTPSREAYGEYMPESPFLLAVLMSWTRLPPIHRICYSLLSKSDRLPWITACVFGNNTPYLSFDEKYDTPPPRWMINSQIIPGVPIRSPDSVEMS